MRLGHTCTLAHLARLNIVRDASCKCGAEFGDINHILFSCPLLDRSAFINDLMSCRTPFPISIVTLLHPYDPIIYKCIESFINVNNLKL